MTYYPHPNEPGATSVPIYPSTIPSDIGTSILSDEDIDRIAQRVIELLDQRESRAA